MRWMVETSDYVPWEKDPRFPAVHLASPKEQLEQRTSSKVMGTLTVDRSDFRL